MSERTEAYFQQFVGQKIETSIYRIKGKKMSEYAASIGDLNPKYYVEPPADGSKADYSKIVAHPAYAATYTIPGLFKIADVNGEDGQPLIKNVGKLLHTGQAYDYTDCAELTEEVGKVYTDAEMSKFWIKSEILWVEVKLVVHDKDNTKTFCRATLTVGIRKGGY